jgi:hypothetical protein
MTGCQAPLEAVHRLAGSLLLELEDDQASCGRRCATDGECTGTAPTCTPGVFSSSVAAAASGPASGPSGACTVRRAEKGARCSMRSIIGACDVSVSPNLICTDLGLENGDNMDPMNKYGVCAEICDMVDQVCRLAPDPGHRPTCQFGFFNDPMLGVCSDKCSAFPDDCTGPGSAPQAGDMARGSRCVPFVGGGTLDAPDQSFCVDVEQHGPLLSAYDFHTQPATSCDRNWIACPDETICVAMASSGVSVCVYGCSAAGGGKTGCEGTGLPSCKPDFGTGTHAGICEPMSSP